jgi:uncharacterized protein (TIGR03382 family)
VGSFYRDCAELHRRGVGFRFVAFPTAEADRLGHCGYSGSSAESCSRCWKLTTGFIKQQTRLLRRRVGSKQKGGHMTSVALVVVLVLLLRRRRTKLKLDIEV